MAKEEVHLTVSGPHGDRELRVASPARVVWPGPGLTKLDLARYMVDVGDAFLAANGDRPVTLQRFKDTVDGEQFFSKNPPKGAPEFIRAVDVVYPSGRTHPQLVIDEIAAAVWAVPGGIVEGDVLLFKAVVSAMSCAFGIFLLWYSGAGRTFELQVDMSRREIREAMRNDKGQARVRQRYGFDEVDKILVHSDEGGSVEGSLMLVLQGSDALIEVVRVPEHQLYALRNRLARDVAEPQSDKRKQNPVAAFASDGAVGYVPSGV